MLHSILKFRRYWAQLLAALAMIAIASQGANAEEITSWQPFDEVVTVVQSAENMTLDEVVTVEVGTVIQDLAVLHVEPAEPARMVDTFAQMAKTGEFGAVDVGKTTVVVDGGTLAKTGEFTAGQPPTPIIQGGLAIVDAVHFQQASSGLS